MTFLEDFAEPLADMYGSEVSDLRSRSELRFDEPKGACDTFGIGNCHGVRGVTRCRRSDPGRNAVRCEREEFGRLSAGDWFS